MIQITEEQERGTLIIHVAGRLDEDRSAVLEARLARESARPVVLDLSRLDYINSQGISILLLAWRRSRREGGSLILAGAQGNVREVFVVTRIDTFIPVAAGVPEGIALVHKPGGTA